MKNKYNVNDKIICVDNDFTCDQLITIGNIYTVIPDINIKYEYCTFIYTNIGVNCHLPSKYFKRLSEIRKEKLEKIYENNKVQI